MVCFLLAATAAGDVVVTTLDGGEPARGISLTADAKRISVHAASGQVVEIATRDVVEILSVPAPARPAPATRPFQVELTDGSRLRGVLEAAPGGWLRLRSPMLRQTGGHLDIPFEKIRAVERVAGADVPGASRLVRIPGRDAAYRLDGGRVEGFVAEFGASSVVLERDELKPVSIEYAELAALFIDNPETALPKELHVVARMADGSALRLGPDFGVARGVLSGTTPAGVAVQAPAAQLAALGFQGGRFVHVSDLEPARAERKPFFPIPEGPAAAAMLDFVCPVRIDQSPDGGAITLSGQRYFKGLGVRPHTELTYALDGGYTRFVSDCGIDDEVLGSGYGRGAGTGSVVFRVLVDGKEAFESAPVAGGKPPVRVDVDVTGARSLTLVVALVPAAKMPNGVPDSPELDNAVWARPLLIR